MPPRHDDLYCCRKHFNAHIYHNFHNQASVRKGKQKLKAHDGWASHDRATLLWLYSVFNLRWACFTCYNPPHPATITVLIIIANHYGWQLAMLQSKRLLIGHVSSNNPTLLCPSALLHISRAFLFTCLSGFILEGTGSDFYNKSWGFAPKADFLLPREDIQDSQGTSKQALAKDKKKINRRKATTDHVF